ncbi:MAG TPA: pyridine nucleotide-disulfide oxidoreductase, partial [Gammaproteobacteria bacterium]|nr:pyridine nucleotide-disulfide oxidoreductase [Gammaproteobacteria bacterium]
MTRYRFALFLLVITLVAAYFLFDLGQYLSLDYVKSQRDFISEYYQTNSLKTAAIFFLVYIAVTSLSLPGAAILTLAAGAIFGLLWG